MGLGCKVFYNFAEKGTALYYQVENKAGVVVEFVVAVVPINQEEHNE